MQLSLVSVLAVLSMTASGSPTVAEAAVKAPIPVRFNPSCTVVLVWWLVIIPYGTGYSVHNYVLHTRRRMRLSCIAHNSRGMYRLQRLPCQCGSCGDGPWWLCLHIVLVRVVYSFSVYIFRSRLAWADSLYFILESLAARTKATVFLVN